MSKYEVKSIDAGLAFELWQGDEKVRTFIHPVSPISIADCLNLETATLRDELATTQAALEAASERIKVLESENKRMKKALEDSANGILEASSEADYLRLYHKLDEALTQTPQAPVSEAAPKFRVGQQVLSSAGGIGTVKAYLDNGYVDCTCFLALEIDLEPYIEKSKSE